ncbi:MAG: SDR family oxidoreductase [Bryobacteraceae bacterium]|jgi:NAD(P)-dependent dehydrogenase (short-subunit alcohol dehydrogenase family)
MRLSGKTALITGAAGGIGAEIARRFREEGASVFVCDVNRAEGERTAGSMGAVFIPLDVASEESWKAALSAVLERTGRLDVLVNNAGINVRKNIEEMSVESFDAMFAVNVRGPFLGIKHSLPIMRAAGGGVILNMSSICGLVGHRYTNEAYTTTKGALTLLTKSVAVRYAKDNIRCNSVHPSTVETALVQAMLKDPERRAERLGEVPLGRLAGATDVANALVYLASDEASFINGAAIPVDGGLTAG